MQPPRAPVSTARTHANPQPNRNQPRAHTQGAITPKELYTFFREIHRLWVELGEFAELAVYDVVDEILDLVQPAAPPAITPADLAGCRMAGTVFSILADVNLFYEYNYRENLIAQGGGGGGGNSDDQ